MAYTVYDTKDHSKIYGRGLTVQQAAHEILTYDSARYKILTMEGGGYRLYYAGEYGLLAAKGACSKLKNKVDAWGKIAHEVVHSEAWANPGCLDDESYDAMMAREAENAEEEAACQVPN